MARTPHATPRSRSGRRSAPATTAGYGVPPHRGTDREHRPARPGCRNARFALPLSPATLRIEVTDAWGDRLPVPAAPDTDAGDEPGRGLLLVATLAPDGGSDLLVFVHVVSHDKGYSWAKRRLYTVNSVTRCMEVRDLTAMEQITPLFAQEAAAAPQLLLAPWSDTVLRHLGVDDVTLRAARTVTSKAQLEAFGSLMPEDQFEALRLLADGLDPNDTYREMAVRQKESETADDRAGDDLAAAGTRTRSRIAIVIGADELADILAKPFAAWRIFLHPTQRRIAYAGPA